MAFRNRLLATVAIPLIALTGMPSVSVAELLRPTASIEAQSPVIKVQADDDELLKQQRKERRENRKNQRSDDAGQMQQTDQEQVKPRRKKQDAAEEQQTQQNNADQAQQSDQEQVKPRRKKQDAAEEQQTQQNNADQAQQTDQEQVKPRRKKQNAADEQQMQQGDSDQTQQSDEEPVKPRRKKQNAAEDQQMQQNNADQAQQDDQEQVKPRRKKQQDNASEDQNQQSDEQLKNAIDNNNNKRRKQNAAEDQQMQQDNADQAQQGDEEQVKPRRKKQQDNASDDQNQSTDDKLKNAIDNNKRKNNKNQDQAEQPADNNDQAESNSKQKVEHPVDVKKAKDVAKDPAKTTDTVVLPVENGAAVLDSDKDADNAGVDRDRRKREREEVKQRPAPKSDKDAQRGFKEDTKIVIKPVLEVKGERIAGFKGYDDVGGRRINDDRDNRVVINIGGKIVIRSDDERRIARNTEIRYERLPNNLVREVVVRPDGDRIVTVRNRYGEIVRRSRIDRSDREVVIFFSPDLARGRDRLFLRDAGADLPPMRLRIPVRDYIIDVSSSRGGRNYEEFLDEPPVEQVERVYSVDEVKNSARIRDKMRRIDLDTITFETGSSDIAEDQVDSLKEVGQAIKDILDKDPGETFLIEGHTDAVGTDESNLVLSDQRAESVANVLSEAFDIPAENLVTQGYGERFLKVDTDGEERANRRVTIRRITPLVRPLEAAEK